MFKSHSELSKAVKMECTEILAGSGTRKPAFKHVDAAYARASHLALNSEFGNSEGLRKWVRRLGGLNAINHAFSGRIRAGREPVLSFEAIAREVLRHHLELASARKPNPATRSVITGISRGFTKGSKPRLKKSSQTALVRLSVVTEKGIRSILSKEVGENYVNLLANLVTSFKAADDALHNAIIRQKPPSTN